MMIPKNAGILGLGMAVPEKLLTNEDIGKLVDTSDEWIQERTGIKERRYADRTNETTATMGIEAVAANLGPDFPAGIFVCQDAHNTPPGPAGHQNFKLVRLENVIDASSLPQ